MFTTCMQHTNAQLTEIEISLYTSLFESPNHMGGLNSCFRMPQFINF